MIIIGEKQLYKGVINLKIGLQTQVRRDRIPPGIICLMKRKRKKDVQMHKYSTSSVSTPYKTTQVLLGITEAKKKEIHGGGAGGGRSCSKMVV